MKCRLLLHFGAVAEAGGRFDYRGEARPPPERLRSFGGLAVKAGFAGGAENRACGDDALEWLEGWQLNGKQLVQAFVAQDLPHPVVVGGLKVS